MCEEVEKREQNWFIVRKDGRAEWILERSYTTLLLTVGEEEIFLFLSRFFWLD